MRRTYTQEQRDTAAAMARRGYSCLYTASLLNIHRSTLHTWGQACGWTWGTIGRKRHRPQTRAEALRLAQAGLTRHQVAAKLNVPYGTVCKWVHRYGWHWPGVKDMPNRRHSNCDTCPDRPRCSQHHVLCEQPITIDGHPDSQTLRYHEAYP